MIEARSKAHRINRHVMEDTFLYIHFKYKTRHLGKTEKLSRMKFCNFGNPKWFPWIIAIWLENWSLQTAYVFIYFLLKGPIYDILIYHKLFTKIEPVLLC